MDVYSRINELRKLKGIKLSFINEKICGYRGKMTDVKNGKVSLTEKELKIIADELSTTVDYLTGLTDDPSQIEKPTDHLTDGLKKYDMLSNENKAAIDALIDRLLASQSGK